MSLLGILKVIGDIITPIGILVYLWIIPKYLRRMMK